MNWQIGDRAILVNCRLMENEGLECSIMGLMTLGQGRDGVYRGWPIQCASGDWIAHPYNLRPIPDDKHKRFHKALNKTEWSDCEFNPMVTVEIEQ